MILFLHYMNQFLFIFIFLILSHPSSDMDEECYPAISMSTATNNTRWIVDPATASPSSSQSNSSHSTSASQISLNNSSSSSHQTSSSHRQSQKMQIDTQDQQLLQNSALSDNVSTSSCDEIDIDDTCIKDEPLSPSSSCPPSPVSPAYGINLNMANVAAFTNADLVFEHKVSLTELWNTLKTY